MEKRSSQTKVKVVVRLRPALSTNEKTCVSVVDNRVQILNHRNIEESLQYEFNTVFDEKTSQVEVFSTSVEPLLEKVLHGQNVSVFAYGPTGAGKTHTMLGVNSDPGIIPRVIQSLFKTIELKQKSANDLSNQAPQFKVTFSYMEIYNEKVRTVAATNLNKYSSRSHTILLLKIHRKEPSGKELRGKLYLIDLAGSEDNRRTGNKGIRLKESGAINKSLFVLGEVVDAINQNQPRIPYRNSKLTRLLQDSIGGGCHSVMITNIAPEEKFYYDTYCTLNFATKSKKIVNSITTHVVDNIKIEKPTATVRPIKRLSGSVPPSKPKLQKSSSSLPSLTSADSLSSSTSAQANEPLPSPLVRQQKAFEFAIQEKISAMEKLVETLQFTSNNNAVGPEQPSVESKASSTPSSRRTRSSLQLSLVSVHSDDSPDVICPTPKASSGKLTDATNLLKQRHFGPPPQKAKKQKMQYKVIEDNTSCSPLFPKTPSQTRKRGSSQDFESPTTKKIKEAPSKFNNEDQVKRNAEFLGLLNTATVKELQELQTVGVKRAKMIFEWRKIHGDFTSTQGLLEVPGFSDKVLKKLLRNNFVTET
ncbi:kinesin-like protein [Elysia marginata]|uniref:Kinesin-like protein n=1 Tax=Elysia marginata TaxID=1093978 RepID=A0AAV4F1W0_9GAST|nr:kinesin-like protein [Elysia marginata]